jgi:O-antigen/teichoic acid export membrane protein
MNHKLRQLFAAKLTRDFAWTFGSVAVLGVSGILVNILVVATRDASALGVFNLTYAVYIVASQLASYGVHYSALRHAAILQENREESGRMLFTAMLLALGLGAVASVALGFAAPLSRWVFGSSDVAEALSYAAWGLLFFPLNKVMVSYANSLRHMKAFALLQSTRYISVLVVVAVVCLSGVEFTYAALAFVVAESVTCLFCFIMLGRMHMLPLLRVSRPWAKRHLVFGSKGVMAGILFDLNTRLDVLLLGTMLSDRAVGIYSFAAMLIEGLQQLFTILRVNFNPLLVTALRDGDHSTAVSLLKATHRYVRLGTACLCGVLLAAFMIAVHWLIPGKGLEEGLGVLLVLGAGLTLISAFVPFDNLLMVSGHPGYQTAQSAFISSVNALLCLALVPAIGITGAALATAAGYIAGIGFLLYYSPRLVGWDMRRNRFAN